MHISILDPQSSEWLNLVIPLSVIIEEKNSFVTQKQVAWRREHKLQFGK